MVTAVWLASHRGLPASPPPPLLPRDNWPWMVTAVWPASHRWASLRPPHPHCRGLTDRRWLLLCGSLRIVGCPPRPPHPYCRGIIGRGWLLPCGPLRIVGPRFATRTPTAAG